MLCTITGVDKGKRIYRSICLYKHRRALPATAASSSLTTVSYTSLPPAHSPLVGSILASVLTTTLAKATMLSIWLKQDALSRSHLTSSQQHLIVTTPFPGDNYLPKLVKPNFPPRSHCSPASLSLVGFSVSFVHLLYLLFDP